MLDDPHELLRLRVRQRLEQECVDDGENGGVAADAGAERHDDDGREAARLPQHPGRYAEIAPQVLEQRQRARLAVAFLGLFDAAHCAPSRGACLVAGHAPPPELVFEDGQVRRHLPRELLFSPSGPQKVAEAAEGTVGTPAM